jgi:serine/threonine protein kinase
MSNKIGRFEILSEIHHSGRVTIYKASDSESENAKTIILKALRLEPFGEQSSALVENLLQESQAGKLLKSQNIGMLFDAGKIDGLFCAQMEYVEGNSVATMVARKEGFSIWDIMDITRQACQGLEYAHSKELAHYTLEPAKIMVAWDGTVKVLGFGVSTMSAWAAQATGAAPEVLYYMSPEQLAGDLLDRRSNIFSIGAILYEMVTDRKPFNGDDAAGVRQAIQEMAPVPPDQVNCKIHPVLSHVIMKALAKDPEERFTSGQELVKELDRCRENATKTAAKAAPTPAKKAGVSAPPAGFVQPERLAREDAATAGSAPASKPDKKAVKSESLATSPAMEVPQVQRAAKVAAASAAGSPTVGCDQIVEWQTAVSPQISSPAADAPELVSALVVEEPNVQPPKIAVDPLMAGGGQRGDAKSLSFSEIDELPPLKEVRIAPPPPAAEPEPVIQEIVAKKIEPEKPKLQVRAVAKKAMKEVQKTPPRLFLYSISAAVAVILVIVAAMAYHFHSENSADDNPPAPAPAATAPANEVVAPAAPVQATPAAPETPAVEAPPVPQAEETVVVSEKPRNVAKKKIKAPSPVVTAVVTGQVSISSTPAGAQIQIDGRSDPAWLTPYDMAALQPGQHTVAISKPGFATDSRTIEVASGSKSFLSVQLAPLTATVLINSDPAGAEVWMDGKDTGKVTPAQFTLDKAGTHSFSFKKQGYLEEIVSANLQIGQTSHVSSSLRALGNTDDIRMGGKLKKFLGGGDTAGMGSVAVKTQPKGAQVSVNNRVLDKTSPLQFYLDPGNYVVDITLSGFKSVHHVVTVDKGGKVVIEESLDRE